MTEATDPRGSFHACVDYWAERRPEHIALEDADGSYSYSELAEKSTALAKAFVGSGLKTGDRIAWLGKNRAAYAMLMVAASRAGLVIAPIGWRLALPEICYILQDTGAKWMLSEPDFATMARDAKEKCPELETIVCTHGCEHLTSLVDWMAAQPNDAELPPTDPENGVLQLYTSGTTGLPKGATLCNRNLFGLRQAVEESDYDWARLDENDKGLVVMPIAHIAGSGYTSMFLHAGATAYFLPEYDPAGVLDSIEAGVTNIFLVPTAIQMLINHPSAAETDFSRLRYMHYGASPMPLALLRQAMQVLGCGFVQHYGMTETTGTFTCLHPSDHDPEGNKRMRSAGLPMPEVEVRIVDSDNASVATGEVGEIVTRSKANMLGYWKQPEKTAETVDPEGWLHTGDAGYMDEDGYVYIHDRVKDMIISGGENVYPAEVENTLYSHPAVLEAAVIGVPDDKWGEAVKAVIVPRPGHEIESDEVIAFARESLAVYKVPKSIDVIPEMPRNASGKILRRELRAPYWEGKDRQVN
ncbi:long-chain-fatty-acid--CoA ligase [Alterisphingorhabdus coralli]|uniref:3-methylmercaptopropionyl-CoA ligase n=1 Tax=Alterisphingorhabdus coralli TaxID=3071408 RepID=A0AA97I0H0_9SPHN|nr:long-chain-fatty-acid--CoA ligase [Parasphingorhabdus sp. SCSIO 66989]WOE74190.1 long-chain-fatty-acid--CoA ligase [Parasphingorhabdus sp. SCSIO 66989]